MLTKATLINPCLLSSGKTIVLVSCIFRNGYVFHNIGSCFPKIPTNIFVSKLDAYFAFQSSAQVNANGVPRALIWRCPSQEGSWIGR